MNKYVLSALVVPAMLFGSLNAQAKTAALKAKVNRVQEGANYVSGKATRGANIKITSHGVTYVAGKANKKGKFEINAHHSFKVGKYRVTISKRGYKVKAFQFKINADEPTRDVAVTTNTSQVDSLNSQISKSNEQVVSLTNQLNDTKKNQDSANARQQQVLKNQIASLTNQLNATRSYYTYSTAHETVNSIKLAAANRKVSELQNKVAELDHDLTTDNRPAKTGNNLSTKVTTDSSKETENGVAASNTTAVNPGTDDKKDVPSVKPTDVQAKSNPKNVDTPKPKTDAVNHLRQDPDGSIQKDIDRRMVENEALNEAVANLKIKLSDCPTTKKEYYVKRIGTFDYQISRNKAEINHDRQQLDKI